MRVLHLLGVIAVESALCLGAMALASAVGIPPSLLTDSGAEFFTETGKLLF